MARAGIENAAINYDDFAVCASCRTVILRGKSKCMSCGFTGPFHSIDNAPRLGCGAIVAWMIGLATIPLLVLFPIGTIAGVGLLYFASSIYKGSKLKASEERHRYQREATALMNSFGQAQDSEAKQSYESGLTHFECGQFELASDMLRTAVQLGGGDIDVRFALASSYYNCQNYPACIPMLESIRQANAPPTGSGELLARAYLAVGISRREQVEFLMKERNGFSSKLNNAIVLALARYLEADLPLDDSAIPLLEEAFVLEPSSSKHISALIEIMVRHQDWGKGVTYACRLPIENHDSRGVALYAQCLAQMGDISESAAAVYRRQLETHADDVEVRLRLGQSLIKSKRPSEAIETYQNGIRGTASDIKLRYHLALVNLMAEKIEDSIAELQALLRTDGFQEYRSKDDIYRLLGRCFIRNGMLETALKQYLLASRSQENIEELYKLGELFESRSDCKNARACWEEIYATDVRFRDVAAKIAAVVK